MEEEKPTAKILILGPTKSGKTTLVQLLAEFMEDGDPIRKGGQDASERERKFEFEFTNQYRPTKGVRIQEFETHEFFTEQEKNELGEIRRLADLEMQLWDVSGDTKYEDCWPAIKENVNGVILVANPEEHTGNDLQMWWREFVEKESVDSKCVMVILNEQGARKTNHEQISGFEILPQLRGVNHVAHHFGTEAMQVKMEVNAFMATVLRSDRVRSGGGDGGGGDVDLAESHGLEYRHHVEEEEEEEEHEEENHYKASEHDDLDDF